MRVLLVMGLLALISHIGAAAELDVPSEVDEASTAAMDPRHRGFLLEASEAMAQGRMSEAEPLIRKVLDDDPESRPARQLLMAVLVELKRDRDASEAFVALYPGHRNDFMFLNNYAWFLVKAEDPLFRDPVRALAVAQEAILLAPDVYQVWSTLAEARFVNGDFERAARAMHQAIDLAIRQNADTDRIKTYRADLQRMLEARAVMTLME